MQNANKFLNMVFGSLLVIWPLLTRVAIWIVALWATADSFDLTEIQAAIIGVLGEAGIDARKIRSNYQENAKEKAEA